MNQSQKRLFLIKYLLAERNENLKIPSDALSRKRLLRALFNVRPPSLPSAEFLKIQDEYLQEEIRRKGITDVNNLLPVFGNVFLWQGDITTLKCDGIVNAANSRLLGCFCPNHGCIDNAIHTFAGVQLRLECAKLTTKRDMPEPSGRAVITSSYNLPCRYVLHTVGPIVDGALTKYDKTKLADCYRACLNLADEYNLQSLAFCCVSTGEFGFPNEEAARIAIDTVTNYKAQTRSNIKIVFNVFKNIDYEIYSRLLKSTSSS